MNGQFALLHRPLPSLSRLTLRRTIGGATTGRRVACTIPLPLCERWRLACVCLIATPTVPLLLLPNQSKLLSFQLWFARLHANPKATPMAPLRYDAFERLADGNGILPDAAQKLVEMWCVIRHMRRHSVLDCAVCRPSLLASGNRNGEVVVHDLRSSLRRRLRRPRQPRRSALRRQLHQITLTPPQHLLLLSSTPNTNPPLRRRQR